MLENCCGGGEAGGGRVPFNWGTPEGGVENAHYGAWIAQHIYEDFLALCQPCDATHIFGTVDGSNSINVLRTMFAMAFGGISPPPSSNVRIPPTMYFGDHPTGALYRASTNGDPTGLLTESGFKSA